MSKAIEHHMAIIYEALTGKNFDGTYSWRCTAAAARNAGLTLDEAHDVLLNMVERGDKITPATLKVELEKRAEQAVFEVDSEDGDAPSDDRPAEAASKRPMRRSMNCADNKSAPFS
jgi:hypothetical protein